MQGRRAPNALVLHSIEVEVYMKSILDPSFRYTKSVETDLRKTFARVRRELRKQTQQSVSVEAMRKVLPFQSRKDAA